LKPPTSEQPEKNTHKVRLKKLKTAQNDAVGETMAEDLALENVPSNV